VALVLRVFPDVDVALSPAVEAKAVHLPLDHLPFILANELLPLQVLVNSVPVHLAVFPFSAVPGTTDKSIYANPVLLVCLPLSLVKLPIDTFECPDTMRLIFHEFTVVNRSILVIQRT
jgi:hypothetical protein